jgi:hypothetical protein
MPLKRRLLNGLKNLNGESENQSLPSIHLTKNFLEFIINMIQSVYPLAFSQFMGCFTFATTLDFVGLYGQLGPSGWNVTVAIFKWP